MNTKRFWLTVVAVFVVQVIYELLEHGWILNNMFYKGLSGTVMLSANDPRMINHPFLANIAVFVAMLIVAFFFTLIYTRGVEDKGWMGEGLRYGILVWGVAALPMYVSMYGWSKFPAKLLLWWVMFALLEFVILGWVCAALYKKEASKAPAAA